MKAPPRAPAELLLLPDGRILAHNLTPAVAALLAELDPRDESMRQRAASAPLPPSSPSISTVQTASTTHARP